MGRTWTTRRLQIVHQYYLAGIEGKDWYNNTLRNIQAHFGCHEKGILYVKFLAATSPMASIYTNTLFALKAMKAHEEAREFSEFIRAHRMNLDRVVNNKPMQGQKVIAFADAMLGDENAVVVDRWVLRAFGIKTEKPNASQYKRCVKGILILAKRHKVSPREYQAAVWTGTKKIIGDENRHSVMSFDEMLNVILSKTA